MRLYILIAIFSLFPRLSSGQTAQQLYSHALELYSTGDYSSAVSSLRRVIFFDDLTYRKAYKVLGDCYKKLGERDKSLYYYKLAKNSAESDSIAKELQFDIVGVHLIFDEPNYALINLFAIKPGDSEYFYRKKELYTSFAYFLVHDFSLSEKYFRKTFDTSNISLVNSVDSLFKAAQKNDGFNVYVPMVLSAVPGLGQMYLGNFEAGINSILLTGVFAGLYIYSIAHLGLLDSIITFLPWFHRYYSGGMLQAKSLAVNKKENSFYLNYNKLMEIAIEHSNLTHE